MSCNYIVRNKIGRFRPSPPLPRYRVRDLTHASDNRFNKPPECPRIHNVVLLQIFDHAAMLLPNCLQVRDQIFKILRGRQEEIILLDKLWWAWSILYVLRVRVSHTGLLQDSQGNVGLGFTQAVEDPLHNDADSFCLFNSLSLVLSSHTSVKQTR